MNNPENISALGSDLVRIGSALRLHPDNPEAVHDRMQHYLPLLIAVTSSLPNTQARGAVISEVTAKRDGGFSTIKLTIRAFH